MAKGAKGDDEVKKPLCDLKAKQVKVITVAVGPHVNLRQLKNIDDEADVLHFGENESSRHVGKNLLHSKGPKKYTKIFSKPCVHLD